MSETTMPGLRQALVDAKLAGGKTGRWYHFRSNEGAADRAVAVVEQHLRVAQLEGGREALGFAAAAEYLAQRLDRFPDPSRRHRRAVWALAVLQDEADRRTAAAGGET